MNLMLNDLEILKRGHMHLSTVHVLHTVSFGASKVHDKENSLLQLIALPPISSIAFMSLTLLHHYVTLCIIHPLWLVWHTHGQSLKFSLEVLPS